MYHPPSQCGLLPIHADCKREDYPLLNAKVHYDIFDVQMLANLTQTYTSNASVDAEIRYIFPLPPDSSVCAFTAVINGERTIKGIVKEKEKAKDEYEQAVIQGNTAALLEQANVEIFQVSLGNIRPNQTIEVHISFVSVISHDGSLDSLRLTFPTAIAPRYGTPPSRILSPFRRSASNSKDVLDFSVAVEMTSNIKSITSPSHPIAVKRGELTTGTSQELDPTRARVSLSSSTPLEKDIILVLSCQGLDKPRCIVESFSPEEGGQEHTDAYALTLVPRLELPPLPTQEYIFLVDRSGSMDGGKMKALRSALQIMLTSLPSRGTYLNIMSFGSHHKSLWPSSVAYSDESVKTASAHVDSMTADYGGTEIREAVEAAFASRVARTNGETTSTSVFILTDGQAYDLRGVQLLIRGAVAEAKMEGLLLRVFCMGIGDAVSKAMGDVIARAGHGAAAFVGEKEKPDHKLMGLLRAARSAVIEDIVIDWNVGEDDTSQVGMKWLGLLDTVQVPPPRVQQAPRTESLLSLYPGFRTNLFAIVRREGGNTTPSKSVHIKGTALGQPVVLEVPVSPTSKPTAETRIKVLHSLAARALIQDIEDGEGTVMIIMSKKAKAEVLRLGERYGLASSQTSFVAVDEQGKPVFVAQPDLRYLLETQLGGGGSFHTGAAIKSARRSGSAIPLPRLRARKTSSVFNKSAEQTPTAPRSSRAPASSIETFARAQSVDGSFTGSTPLFRLLVKRSRGPPMPSALDGAGSDKETLWCTLLCVAYLETNFADDKAVWTILVEKAMRFVEDTLRDTGTQNVTERVQELKQAALKCIAR